MKILTRLLTTVLLGLAVPTFFAAQAAHSAPPGSHPGATTRAKTGDVACVQKAYVAETTPESGYETGALHVLYSDGTEYIETLPALAKGAGAESVFNTVGFTDVQIADDRQTVGWALEVQNCCTSYPIALSVAVFRSGRVLRTIAPGQMVWDWMFLSTGKQVGVISGPVHGTSAGDYKLYDVETGRLLSEVFGNEDSAQVRPDAPQWAKALDQHFQNRQ